MNESNPYSPPAAEVRDIEIEEGVLATRMQRLRGALIDAFLLLLVAIPFQVSTGFWDRAMAGQTTLRDTLGQFLFAWVVFFLLQGYPLHTRGQTLGKMVVKTRIVSVKDGTILPLWRVFALRYLLIGVIAQIPLVGAIVSLANPLFIFREDRRCLHDHLAGTKVVQVVA